MRLPLSLCLIAILAYSACASGDTGAGIAKSTPSPSPSPEKDPRAESAYDESLTQEEEEPKARLRVREMVIERAGLQFPGWKVEGVSALAYTGTLYLVAVDLSRGQQRQTANYVVRMYITPGNESYWKIDEMTAELSQALAGWTYLEYQKLRRKNVSLRGQLDEARGGQ